MVNLGLQNFQRPTSLKAWIREDPDTVFRLSSLGIAWGSIIAAVYTMALDGGNYLVIPTGIVVLWDSFYLYRRSRGNPVIPRKCMTWDGTVMVLAFAWAIVYMIITFGNVGQSNDGCGFDPEWCKNMTRVSAAECSSTLLLFPLSLVHLILLVLDIRENQHQAGRRWNGTPLNNNNNIMPVPTQNDRSHAGFTKV